MDEYATLVPALGDAGAEGGMIARLRALFVQARSAPAARSSAAASSRRR